MINKHRDISLDIAKGMCIVLMVMGHSGCPEWISNFIGFFHMPVFFFISGMLLNDRYLDDQKTGVAKKLKGYYKPFVKWTLIFMLFHNAFVSMHILSGKSYTLSDMLVMALRTFTMTGGEQLLGGYWFLISLTWASIGSIVILGLLKKRNYLTNSVTGGVILSMLTIASLEPLLPFAIPAQFTSRTFQALAFFVSGYAYKKMLLTDKITSPNTKTAILMLAVVLVVSFFWHADMTVNNAEELSWLYCIAAIWGTLGFLQLAKMLQCKWIKSLFNYIGNKTLYILTFHFISFKLVSFAWIWWHGMPMERLSEFPVLQGIPAWLWTLYCVAGIAIPLLLCEFKDALVKTFKVKS